MKTEKWTFHQMQLVNIHRKIMKEILNFNELRINVSTLMYLA